MEPAGFFAAATLALDFPLGRDALTAPLADFAVPVLDVASAFSVAFATRDAAPLGAAGGVMAVAIAFGMVTSRV